MFQDFIPDSEKTPTIPASPDSHPSNPEREAVQILVIGSKAGIANIIQTLHSHRFAEIYEWSPLMRAPVPSKLMRSLLRYVPKP